jgi:hypothetical protein
LSVTPRIETHRFSLAWDVASFLAALCYLGVPTQFGGHDVTANPNGRPADSFGVCLFE